MAGKARNLHSWRTTLSCLTQKWNRFKYFTSFKEILLMT